MTIPDDEALLRGVPWQHTQDCYEAGKTFGACSCNGEPDYPAMARVVREAREKEMEPFKQTDGYLIVIEAIGLRRSLSAAEARVAALCAALEQARYSLNELTSSDDPLWGGYKQEHLGDVDSVARQAMRAIDAALAAARQGQG